MLSDAYMLFEANRDAEYLFALYFVSPVKGAPRIRLVRVDAAMKPTPAQLLEVFGAGEGTTCCFQVASDASAQLLQPADAAKRWRKSALGWLKEVTRRCFSMPAAGHDHTVVYVLPPCQNRVTMCERFTDYAFEDMWYMLAERAMNRELDDEVRMDVHVLVASQLQQAPHKGCATLRHDETVCVPAGIELMHIKSLIVPDADEATTRVTFRGPDGSELGPRVLSSADLSTVVMHVDAVRKRPVEPGSEPVQHAAKRAQKQMRDE